MDLRAESQQILIDGTPIKGRILTLLGSNEPIEYTTLEVQGCDGFRGVCTGRADDVTYRSEDRWSRDRDGIRVCREVEVSTTDGKPRDGISLRMEVPLKSGRWRFFVPGACYDYCPIEGQGGRALISEERMAYPLVMAYDEGTRSAVLLIRDTPAAKSEPYQRSTGETRFLHASEIGALGYQRGSDDRPARLLASLPDCEEPHSRMIDRSLSSFTAFLPPTRTKISVCYRLVVLSSPRFDTACFAAFDWVCRTRKPEPVYPPLGLADCVQVRVERLSELVTDWHGHAGLHLNFDPRIGVRSAPSGYGTSFNELDHGIYPDVLEYGFTGRPLNNAYMLATLGSIQGRRDWLEAGKRIVESFLDSCVARTGFLYTLYDVRRRRAINPLGDEIGSRLHYGARGAEEGNYIRNMAEAAEDLCLFAEVGLRNACIGAARAFGDFLLRLQNPDGSWYRAYSPEGKPISSPIEWFGAGDSANKSSTATVIPLLLSLVSRTHTRSYLSAATRAGRFLLEHVVDRADYRGGTLDNPNVVDKEGMAYAMSALSRLYDATGATEFLEGARLAGGMALTWNYLWDVPFESGTRLAESDFKSRGWGGISILWGGGVVDIYSLWFLSEWLDLADRTGLTTFRDVARLVMYGTQQLLSLPGRPMGLAGPGMQEEGFACSNQGVDEGMIAKGDTWGSLGWVFGAGTYGVWRVISGSGRSEALR